MQLWEYRTEEIDFRWDVQELNELGNEGWELVGIYSEEEGYCTKTVHRYAVFKRPKEG